MKKTLYSALLCAGYGGVILCAERILQAERSRCWSALSHRDNQGRTPFHSAAASGKKRTTEGYVARLRDHEVIDILAMQDNRRKTPLQLALENGYGDLFEGLFSRVTSSDVNLLSFGKGRLLDCFESTEKHAPERSTNFSAKLIEILDFQNGDLIDVLQQEVGDEKSFFERAVEIGNVSFVQMLLDKLDTQGSLQDGSSTLCMRSVKQSEPLLMLPIKNKQLEMIKVLWGNIPKSKRFSVLTSKWGNDRSILQYLITLEDVADIQRIKTLVLDDIPIPHNILEHIFLRDKDEGASLLRQAVEVNHVNFLSKFLEAFDEVALPGEAKQKIIVGSIEQEDSSLLIPVHRGWVEQTRLLWGMNFKRSPVRVAIEKE